MNRLGLLVMAAVAGVPAARSAPPRLVDATAASGLAFVHRNGVSPSKHLVEAMGSGVVLLDHDGDGDLDVYLLQSGALGPEGAAGRANELWRNDGGLRFSRVADAAGAADTGVGMGGCAGDVDGDGDVDLMVANYGPDALYLNQEGRFQRAEAGLDGDGWSTSCTFLDAEGDGDLDLYVVSYLDFDPVSKAPACGDLRTGRRSYCHPTYFEGVRDTFYRNDGRGRFTDATVEAGFGRSTGKGLGVIAFDHDLDGDTDLYVANDTTPNFLWRNDGGRFTDVALLSGCAFDENGRALAGMGLAAADVDADGRPDLVVTNFDVEWNTLYLGGPRGFRDATSDSGVGAADTSLLGFPVELFDRDFDGDVDLYVGNGHVLDDIGDVRPDMSHAQPDQLLDNDGSGRFLPAGPAAGDVGAPMVARGSATGDLDGDGDLDLVVTANGGPARLYRNDGAEKVPHVVLDLVGTRCHREALGARAVVSRRGRPAEVLARGEVQGGRSYMSQGSRLLHLAADPRGVDVAITWPGGAVETWRGLAAFGRHRLVEGSSPAPPAASSPAVPAPATPPR